MSRPRRTGRDYQLLTLGERRPSVHAWSDAIARAEASCTFDHATVRTCDGDHLCLRCHDLFKFALIYATIDGEVPALVVLDRLLTALERKVAA